jgi:glucose/arabinose dehydrogenase
MTKFFHKLTLSLAALVVCSTVLAFDMPEINLPDGFQIEVLTDQVPGARSMALGDKGTLFVSTMREGKIYAVSGIDSEPEVLTIASDLYMPNGIAFKDGNLYVAEIHRVHKFENIEDRLSAPKSKIINKSYPTDRHHGWRYIAFGPDGKLYIPIGAPCNICNEPDYGVITRIDTDGSNKEVIAHGIRNTVGITFHPQTNDLWFTDNNKDMMGDDIPPGELNRLSREGEHFGFPFCHATDIPDNEGFDSLGNCSDITPPVQELDAHVAALGLKFYTGSMFPDEYKNQIFIPEHGSWNRSKKSGYRITLVRLNGNQAVSYEVFADGWMKNEETLGRPVDLLVLPDGSMLVTPINQPACPRSLHFSSIRLRILHTKQLDCHSI